MTLAFLPEEAQNFVFALEQGNVYLSLLPPDEAGVEPGPDHGRPDPAPRGSAREQPGIAVPQSIIAVGTPQTFRSTLARALEVEPEDVGWVQSVTAAEEMLVEADDPVDVLVLSPEVKEPDALGLAEFVGRTAPMTAIVMVRDKSWNGLLPAAMRAGIRDVVDLTQGQRGAPRRDRARHRVGGEPAAAPRRDAAKPSQRGMVISVFSSKGGTGKTFLTTNLATRDRRPVRSGHRGRRPRRGHGRRLQLLRDSSPASR